MAAAPRLVGLYAGDRIPAVIDLDALERLAAEAARSPWRKAPDVSVGGLETVYIQDSTVMHAQDALQEACDPATVAALIRAVRAAQAMEHADTALIAAQLEAGTHAEVAALQGEYAKAMYELGAALAPFRETSA